MELGGKNPFVVLKDADLDYAVDCAAFGIYMHQGQVCMANSRIIVEDPVYDEFCARFVARTRTIKVGDPRDPSASRTARSWTHTFRMPWPREQAAHRRTVLGIPEKVMRKSHTCA